MEIINTAFYGNDPQVKMITQFRLLEISLTSFLMIVLGLVLFFTDKILAHQFVLGFMFVIGAITFHRFSVLENLKEYQHNVQGIVSQSIENFRLLPLRAIIAFVAASFFFYFPVQIIIAMAIGFIATCFVAFCISHAFSPE